MLQNGAGHLQASEYFDDVTPGTVVDGVRCENVEKLSFEDACFDLCSSTDVFEHVVNDMAGYKELLRVLKPDGLLVFTVPLNLNGPTVERAAFRDGELVHYLPPEYHDDQLRGRGKVLAFRTYGVDIIDRLLAAGFRDARIDRSYRTSFFGFGRPVVIAHK